MKRTLLATYLLGILIASLLIHNQSRAMTQLGQSPESYDPKYMQGATPLEFLRMTPQGLVVNDGTYDRVLIGYQPDGFGGTGKNFGIKVSQTGYDVKSASNNQLVMDSGFNSFKIAETGTVSLAGAGANNSNTTSVTLTGYSTAPAVLCFLPLYSNAGTVLPAFNWQSDGKMAQIIYSNVITSGSNYLLNFGTQNFTAANDTHTYNIRYYVLQETSQ